MTVCITAVATVFSFGCRELGYSNLWVPVQSIFWKGSSLTWLIMFKPRWLRHAAAC